MNQTHKSRFSKSSLPVSLRCCNDSDDPQVGKVAASVNCPSKWSSTITDHLCGKSFPHGDRGWRMLPTRWNDKSARLDKGRGCCRDQWKSLAAGDPQTFLGKMSRISPSVYGSPCISRPCAGRYLLDALYGQMMKLNQRHDNWSHAHSALKSAVSKWEWPVDTGLLALNRTIHSTNKYFYNLNKCHVILFFFTASSLCIYI